MSEITLSLEHPSLGCGEIIARYDLTEIQEKAYHQGRADTIEKYINKAHSRILYELVDVMADLNEAEILSHDNINEWLCIWKREVTDVIFRAMREVKKVQTNCDNYELKEHK